MVEDLSRFFSDVATFLLVDVDRVPMRHAETIPHFTFQGKIVTEILAHNTHEVVKRLMRLKHPKLVDIPVSLEYMKLNLDTTTCLELEGESSTESTLVAFVPDNNVLYSTDNSQLLIRLSFRSMVKLHSIGIRGVSLKTCPSVVDLYTVSERLHFKDLGTSEGRIQPTQSVAFHGPSDLALLKLDSFRYFSSLTLHVKGNQGDGEKTQIGDILLFKW
jgi:hypothetical protein